LTEIEVVVYNDFMANFRQRCYEISSAGAFHSTTVRYASLYICMKQKYILKMLIYYLYYIWQKLN